MNWLQMGLSVRDAEAAAWGRLKGPEVEAYREDLLELRHAVDLALDRLPPAPEPPERVAGVFERGSGV